MLINNIDQIGKNLPPEIYFLSKKYWPGSLTIIYKDQGYRMPNNKFVLDLIELTGPLWSSSSNISGASDILNMTEAYKLFGSNKDILIFDNKHKPSGIGSTIYCFETGQILREGAVNKSELEKFLVGQ